MFLLLLIWNVGIYFEWFISLDSIFLIPLPFIQKNYSLVCHQQSSKLITEGIHHSLVCARCAGIYLGLLLLSFAHMIREIKFTPSKNLYLFAITPILMDIFLYSIGLYSYSKLIAFITGLFLGSTGFLYLCEGINLLFTEIKKEKT